MVRRKAAKHAKLKDKEDDLDMTLGDYVDSDNSDIDSGNPLSFPSLPWGTVLLGVISQEWGKNCKTRKKNRLNFQNPWGKRGGGG